ncbi:MAG: methyltransferase domain-containing protein [Candidatus Thorarchaeota archaeon]|nr:methyltransferase domain-containing protein [Candidatus Thorarchaeota archaeon]
MSESSGKRHLIEKLDKRRIRVRDIDRVFRLANHTPSSILDVGSGNGAIIGYYSEYGYETVGIEVSESAVKQASKQFPGTKFIHYDGLHFPFGDSSFDTILLNDVLEHISYDDIEQVLAEIHRVLKPNGLVYISVMNRWQLIEPHTLIPLLTWLPRVAWNSVCMRLKKIDFSNVWPYTRGRLQSLFKRHSFSFDDLTNVYVQHKFHGVNPIGNRMTSRIVRLLQRTRLIRIGYFLALKVSVLVYVARKT